MDQEASELNLLSGSFKQPVIYRASVCLKSMLGTKTTNPALRQVYPTFSL